MDLRVLQYFLMVAREENITRAAQLLHITQPTLSRQIKDLEKELNVKLFERGSHAISLTQDGMLLRRRAQELVDLAERTKRDLKHQNADLSGEIALGSGEMLSVDTLSDMLASFHSIHPHVRYRLYSGNADHIKERIENGTLDIGLLSEPVDIAKYEFIRLPKREEWGILTREDSPLGKLPYVTPSDLLHRPLMMSERELVRSEVRNWFGDMAEQVGILFYYNLLYNAAMMVKNGMGDALCIRLNCTYPGLVFVPLSPALNLGSVLVWKKNQIAAPAVAALLEHVKKCLKGISQDIL